jgi:hypothetical protein
MHYKKTLTTLSFVALLMTAVTSNANSMKCGSHIVQDGQRGGPGKYEILKKCGEPTERYGNTWIYDKPGMKRYALTFNSNGVLNTIRRP